MHNEIELTLPNVLILLVCLALTYWMGKAPKSVLKMMSNRYQGLGLDKDRPVLTACVRYFGRWVFFTLVYGMLLMFVPGSISQWPAFSVVGLFLAFGISFLLLRKSAKKDLHTVLSQPTAIGKTPPSA